MNVINEKHIAMSFQVIEISHLTSSSYQNLYMKKFQAFSTVNMLTEVVQQKIKIQMCPNFLSFGQKNTF